MTQEKLESILKQLEEYQKSLDPFDRDKQELMDVIIAQFKEDMPSWIGDNISIECIFEEVIEQQLEVDSNFKKASKRLINELLSYLEIEE